MLGGCGVRVLWVLMVKESRVLVHQLRCTYDTRVIGL